MKITLIGEENVLDTSFTSTSPISSSPVIDIGNSSELKDALEELNKSTATQNLSDIDLRTRLHPEELSSILAFEGLVSLKFLDPSILNLVTYKKRLVVSLMGKGREEIVQLASNNTQPDPNLSDSLKEWFLPKKEIS